MAGRSAGGKGNPASHRIGNPRRKERRVASWLRSEKRHDKNRKENEAAHAANLAEVGKGNHVCRCRNGHHGNGNPARPSKMKRKARRAAERGNAA